MRLKKIRIEAKICLSVISALFILTVGYLLNNNPYSIFDDIDHFGKLEIVNRLIQGEGKMDSALMLVNVSYDKKLVDYIDPETGFREGYIAITDRAKLLRFLSIAAKSDNYKYIFLDVSFEESIQDTDTIEGRTIDEVLFEQILCTPRMVFSNHSDVQLADSSLLLKSGINDYYTTITSTNLIRYKYLYGTDASVALKMYQDIEGKTIKSVGPLYISEGKLCYNSPFLRIPIQFPPKYDQEGNLNYYNLGADILDINDDDECAQLIKDKIIVIGDLIDDVHDTYIGPQPGCYITINAYNGLQSGRHLVNWGYVLVLFIVYFLISMSLLYDYNLFDFIPYIRESRSRILKLIVTFVGYTFLLAILSDSLYFITGDISPILFPSLYFSILSTLIQFKKL